MENVLGVPAVKRYNVTEDVTTVENVRTIYIFNLIDKGVTRI